MMDLKKYVWLSRAAGQRLDLVQAGGGNTSFKPVSGKMVIKASGGLLANMTEEAGWVTVNNDSVIDLLKEQAQQGIQRSKEYDAQIAASVTATVLSGAGRPSIETFLHSLFYTYTLHTHPSSVVGLTLKEKWRELCAKLGEKLGEDVLLVEYATPGISLALELYQALEKHSGSIPKVAFLQNHGLITSAETAEEAMALTNAICKLAAELVGLPSENAEEPDSLLQCFGSLGFDSVTIRRSTNSFLDSAVTEHRSLFEIPPCCPDTLIYGGYETVQMANACDIEALRDYYDKYGEHPKVVLVEDRLYFVAPTLGKAIEIEDVFWGHIQSLIGAGRTDCALSKGELHYLGNWEAEKYRQRS